MGIQGALLAKAKAKEATIHAIVIRADGTREDLGMISYWHKNPLKRLWGNLKIKLKEIKW